MRNCIHTNTQATLPISTNNILYFINYLLTWKKLQANTISGYLTALKVLHFINGFTHTQVDHIFTNYFVSHALQGAKNICQLLTKAYLPDLPLFRLNSAFLSRANFLTSLGWVNPNTAAAGN